MVEKRFRVEVIEEEIPILYDNETNCWYPINDNPTNVKILMNRLNDLDTFRKGYFSLEKQIKQLRDENHRLKLTMCDLNSLNFDIDWLKKHMREWKE